jgi:outer membrane protein assembly factor BamB
VLVAGFDPDTGLQTWETRIVDASPGPIYANGGLAVLEFGFVDDTQTIVVDPADGHVVWDRHTSGVEGYPVGMAADGTMMVVGGFHSGQAWMVRPDTGEVLFELGGAFEALRTADQVFTVVDQESCEPNCVIAGYTPNTGTELWRQTVPTEVAVLGPSPNGDALVSNSENVVSMQAGDGTARWTTPMAAGSTLGTVGDLLLMRDDRKLTGLSVDDGSERFAKNVEPHWGVALAGGDVAYVVSGCCLEAVETDSSDGSSLWNVELPSGFQLPQPDPDQAFAFGRAPVPVSDGVLVLGDWSVLKYSTSPPLAIAAPSVGNPVQSPAPPTTVIVPAPGGESAIAMPTAIDGYVVDGTVQSGQARVFEGDEVASTPLEFGAQMNDCADAMWTARWRSLNPNITVYAVRDPYDSDHTQYPADARVLGSPAAAGYLSGYICERPAFIFGTSTNAGNLEDVVVEWQYWRASP